MPVFSRKAIRRDLGRAYLRDTIVSSTNASLGLGVAPFFVSNHVLADTSLSGMSLYQGGYFLVEEQEHRIASFNTASGAFVTLQAQRPFTAQPTGLASGTEFEVHMLLSPNEKDRIISKIIESVRLRKEVPINSIDGGHIYPLASAAAGVRIDDVLEIYSFATPAGTLGRDRRANYQWQVVTTGSGLELRIEPALGASQQLIVDAILEVTLGASSEATVELPTMDWVVAGAAARALWLAEADAPEDATVRRQRGTQPPPQYRRPTRGELQIRRREAAVVFSRLSAIHQPRREKRIQLDEPY